MLAIVAFCVACLNHRENPAFVVEDQLRHGTPCAFWWDPVLLRDNIAGLSSFATQSLVLSTANMLTGGLVYSFYEEVGKDKTQTNTRSLNRTEMRDKFNWFATYSAGPEGRKQVERKSQIYSISDQTYQVDPPWQQIFHISGVKLHDCFKALFKMTLNTGVTTPPDFL